MGPGFTQSEALGPGTPSCCGANSWTFSPSSTSLPSSAGPVSPSLSTSEGAKIIAEGLARVGCGIRGCYGVWVTGSYMFLLLLLVRAELPSVRAEIDSELPDRSTDGTHDCSKANIYTQLFFKNHIGFFPLSFSLEIFKSQWHVRKAGRKVGGLKCCYPSCLFPNQLNIMIFRSPIRQIVIFVRKVYYRRICTPPHSLPAPHLLRAAGG